MTAVPNYARMNRVGPPAAYLRDPEINYAPGSIAGNRKKAPAQVGGTAAPDMPVAVNPHAGAGATAFAGSDPGVRGDPFVSKVWI